MVMKKIRILILVILCGVFGSCDPNFWLDVLTTTLVDMSASPSTNYNSAVGTATYVPSTYTGVSSSSSSSQGYQKTAHPRKCTSCSHVGNGKCKNCGGTGKWFNSGSSKYQTCPHCNGSGKCQVCNGTGSTGVDYY